AEGAQVVLVSAAIEEQIADMEDPEEKEMFLGEYGLTESGLNKLIRAEVIKLADYQEYKTEVKIKEAGKMAVEGKDYVVQDGDIMHFRFNV
ncbi:MAG: DUF933 domain-containing protein, partial [Hymenobacter sp.]